MATATEIPLTNNRSIFPVLLVNFIGTLGYSIVLPFLVVLVIRLGGNEIIYGLHEQERDNVRFLPSEQFENKIKEFFQKPDECVFGTESANQALIRFSNSIESVIDNNDTENIAVVSHGTVISLFVSKYNQIEPFHFWQSLTMPSIVRLSKHAYKVIEPIYTVEEI